MWWPCILLESYLVSETNGEFEISATFTRPIGIVTTEHNDWIINYIL